MESLESLVRKMESQMDQADSKLDILTTRLDQFETKVLLPAPNEGNPSEEGNRDAINGGRTQDTQVNTEDSAAENGVVNDDDDDDDDGLDPKLLTELLVEVRRVKEEYDQLLNDVHQVQELQQEVTRSLRKQMKQVQNHFGQLRDRVIGNVSSNK